MPSTSDTDLESDAGAGSEPTDPVARAVRAFRDGEPVLVHDADDREGETDIIYPAGSITADAVAHLRNDAGGLVCVALGDAVATALDLPFLDAVLDHPTAADHDLAYDSRSSFSLPINHRETFTGITDADRALTIGKLVDVVARIDAGEEYDVDDFSREFRSPGHVHVLRAAGGLLDERRGHTELGVALARAAGLPPAAVVCEMLDDETGDARSAVDAREYARANGYVFVEGRDLVSGL